MKRTFTKYPQGYVKASEALDNSASDWEYYFGEGLEESDEDKQLEVLQDLEYDALEAAGIECVDASVQGRQGTIVFQKGRNVIDLDYYEFTTAELDIAYTCNSPEEYKEAIVNYLNRLFSLF